MKVTFPPFLPFPAFHSFASLRTSSFIQSVNIFFREFETCRGASDFIDTFKADLKQGNNPVLVKSSERGGGWSMFFGVEGDPGVTVVAVEPIGKLTTSWGNVKATY